MDKVQEFEQYKQSKSELISKLFTKEDNNHCKLAYVLREIFPQTRNTFYTIYKYVERIKSKKEKNRVIKLADEIENELMLNAENGLKLLANLNLYICFESHIYTKSLDFHSIYYDIERDFLIEYIAKNKDWYKQVDYCFDLLTNQREIKALTVLMSNGEIDYIDKYLDLVKWLNNNKIILRNYDIRHLNFMIETFLNAILGNAGLTDVLRERMFSIGNSWESLCNEVAKHKYVEILNGHQNRTKLCNGKIPDIIPEINIKRSRSGLISYADTIIECKKSLYFVSVNLKTQRLDLNITNITANYKRYCKELQYWILERRKNREIDYNDDIQCLFYEDFMQDISIPESLKLEITALLEDSEINKNTVSSWLLSEEMKNLFFELNNQISSLKELRSKVLLNVRQLNYFPIVIRVFDECKTNQDIMVYIKNLSNKEVSFNYLNLANYDIKTNEYVQIDVSELYLADLISIKPKELKKFILHVPETLKGKSFSMLIGVQGKIICGYDITDEF